MPTQSESRKDSSSPSSARPDVALNDVAAEAVLLAGGGAAILLQLANPAVARGVARHSDFVSRPLDRLFGTLDFVYTLAYGDEQMLASVIRTVNRAHGPVRDRGPSASYNAFDPELQRWVAATLYYAASQVHQQIGPALDALSAEAMYQDYAQLGTRLQMPEGLWPADHAQFQLYWHEAVAQLESSEESRAVVQSLMHPTSIPFYVRPAMPTIRLLSIGFLPDSVRELHGLKWNERKQARFDRLLRVTRFVYPKLPRSLRHLPRDRSLARVRRGLATTTPTMGTAR